MRHPLFLTAAKTTAAVLTLLVASCGKPGANDKPAAATAAPTAGAAASAATTSARAALLLSPAVAAFGALVFGWFAVRLSGVYLAMLTLAFAQIAWAVVYQWDGVTGGSNGINGVWPRYPVGRVGVLLTRMLRSNTDLPSPVTRERGNHRR